MSTYWKCPTCNYVMIEEQSKGYRGCPTGMHAVKHEPLEWDKLGFEIPPDRGYSARALYLKEPNNSDALIEIFKDGQPLRRFLFPAYKIWNIAAHFRDIVDGEIENSARGYNMAAWDGISGATLIGPHNEAQDPRTAKGN